MFLHEGKNLTLPTECPGPLPGGITASTIWPHGRRTTQYNMRIAAGIVDFHDACLTNQNSPKNLLMDENKSERFAWLWNRCFYSLLHYDHMIKIAMVNFQNSHG